MKRSPWYVVTGAVAGFAAVLGLHGLGGTPAALSRPATGGQGTGKAVPGGGRTGSGGAQAASHAPNSGGGAAGPARSATGALVPYGYGELAVRVSVKGKRITSLSVATLRTADPYSQQLAQQEIPVLRSEVLAAHSARVNAVSGATYTSQAYLDSVQSALDKLHFG